MKKRQNTKKEEKLKRRQRQLHDGLVKYLLDPIGNVRDLLQALLLSDILLHFDLEQLAHDKTNYVTQRLTEYRTDLVFDTRFRDSPAAAAVLIEHKFSVPDDALEQMMLYVLLIRRHDKRNGRPKRFVLPIVLYHSKTDWDIESLRAEIAALPENLRPFSLSMEAVFINLASFTFEQIEAIFSHNKHLQKGIATLKFAARINKRTIKEVIQLVFGGENEAAATDEDQLETQILLDYIFGVTPDNLKDSVVTELKKPEIMGKVSFIRELFADELKASEQERKDAVLKANRVERELNRAEQRATLAEQRATRIEQERTRAEQERTRAEQERTRAEQERAQGSHDFVLFLLGSFPQYTDQQIADIVKCEVATVTQIRAEK